MPPKPKKVESNLDNEEQKQSTTKERKKYVLSTKNEDVLAVEDDLEYKSVIIYGIKNCSQVRTVIKQFEDAKIQYEVFDYKKTIPSERLLRRMIQHIGLNVVVNVRSPSFKKQTESKQKEVMDVEDAAIELLQSNTSIIKRPITFVPRRFAIDTEYIVANDQNLIKQVIKNADE